MTAGVYTNYATESLRFGIAYLLKAQSEDGFWRDYELPPGPSEDWTTAWVGWCLAQAPGFLGASGALRRAARAVTSAHREGGWGYNRRQAPDADSTAWAWRFLAALGSVTPSATAELEPYLDVGGSAHTFLEGDSGSWGAAHPDVTPVVGLALLATAAAPVLICRVRGAVLRACGPGGTWPSFWWNTDAYATAWSVEFLARSGGVPQEIAADVHAWSSDLSPNASVIEVALRLLAALAVNGAAGQVGLTLVDAILDRFDGPNGWPPSALLMVPPKGDTPGGSGPHQDVAGLLSTAIATVALARWVSRTSVSRF